MDLWFVTSLLANNRILGAKPSEVTAMNTLTSNIHSMLITFYRPTEKKFKILIEQKAFPSDHVGLSNISHASKINRAFFLFSTQSVPTFNLEALIPKPVFWPLLLVQEKALYRLRTLLISSITTMKLPLLCFLVFNTIQANFSRLKKSQRLVKKL